MTMNRPPWLTISLSETFRCDYVERGPDGAPNLKRRVQGEGRVEFNVHAPHQVVLAGHDLSRLPVTVFVDFEDTTKLRYGGDQANLGVFRFWSTNEYQEQARLELAMTLPDALMSRFENQTPMLHVLLAALDEWSDEDFSLKWDGTKGLYVKQLTVVGATTAHKKDVGQEPSERETLSRIGELLIRGETRINNFTASLRTAATGVFWIFLVAYVVFLLREAVRWLIKA
jgi:hypothetical protein